MHELAFVLNRDWPDLLSRKAGPAAEVSVAQLRGWIGEEQPGLPAPVQNLLIAAYAVQADKAWLRAGRPAEPPRLDKVPDDLVLRSQELPTQPEFETASARADGIFRIKPQPVRTARSVHTLAEAVRRNAAGRLEAVRELAAELDRHAATLGLDETADRQVTSQALAGLLARLAATTDDTLTVRVLAVGDLPRENAFYHAHLDSAERLTSALRQVNWQVLDELAAGAGDAEASVIVSALRQASRRDEQEIALTAPLRQAGQDAITLFLGRAKKPEPTPVPPPAPAPAARPRRASAGRRTAADPGPRPRGARVRRADLRGRRREPGRGVRDRLADRGTLMELVANRSVVEHELRRARASRHGNQSSTVLLLRAAPRWHGDPDFSVEDKGQLVPVTVAPCATVLAVLDALAASRPAGGYLVVLTPCDTREVGDSVLALAIQPEIKPVDRWDLVKDAFGALRLDPALTKRDGRWVAEALLDAQPAGGWRRLPGPVLSRDAALNRLAATRLGIEDADDSPVDAAALLQWTTDEVAVESFLRLRAEERDGIIAWLSETAPGVADVAFALAGAGKVADAIPFGLVAVALYGPPAHAGAAEPEPAGGRDEAVVARVRAEERYLGGLASDGDTLRVFGEAAESLVQRWTENGHAAAAAALCARAEVILTELAVSTDARRALARRSRVLETGLDARLVTLAGVVTAALASPGPAELAAAEDALTAVRAHGRARDRDGEIQAAIDAVRLCRWLTAPEPAPATLAEAATGMLRSWAWADRALASLARPDTGRVPELAQPYASLQARARSRRAQLDTGFARRLAAWTEASSESDDLLLVENLLHRIARPVAEVRPPVIVVLDGMTAAAGLALAGELTSRGGWLEAGRRADRREPALATVPSVTAVSRTSLLAGTLKEGGQAEERAGFTAFWGRRKSALFHKADLAPEPGRSLAGRVRDAIASTDTVVGIVLNTIDDTLDKGKHGPAHWAPDDVDYLRPVLDEARRAGRPVILTADHGHVLHQEQGPANTGQSDAGRYRLGVSSDGEITVRGPRVLVPGSAATEVVAAVDEAIHYTARRAGYHGGAAPAEVVIPVITLLPSDALLPPGWFAYDPAGHAPAWWDAPLRRIPPPAVPAPAKPARPRRKAPAAADADALFGVTEVTGAPVNEAASTLGARVTASTRMASQRQAVPRAPAEPEVAALVDALAEAGGRLTIAEVAAVTGQPAVRMSRYLAQVARLLNVDSYAVLTHSEADRLVELSVPLLRQQFLGE
jgi:hypothetical protein